MLRIGVDTGGTFTDFVFSDGNRLRVTKIPSTPGDPSEAIRAGLQAGDSGRFLLVHGTTVSTNAFLQRKMARTAFVCSEGFEHLLQIGRQNRVDLFSLTPRKADGIIPHHLCFGLRERIGSDGTVVTSLNEADVHQLCDRLRRKKATSVALVFLHAYRYPDHEARAAAIMRSAGLDVTASHEILPEYREYERAVVTTLNAALKPVVVHYVDRLSRVVGRNPLYIMQSSGGVLTPERVMSEPVRTLVSGPAGGVIAAGSLARVKKISHMITVDMGGTSTDVSLIKDGQPQVTRSGALEHLPLRLPMIDIATVGAGGGSVARIDRAGVLQVGPESAGADPGPACYGRAMRPTVTDACVVSGIITPQLFLGGRMPVDKERSIQAVEKLARSIGKPLQETAEGIIQISVSRMERALRSITLERGEDPRRYTLLPFGGAGGMVACLLARRLAVDTIVIPPFQGVFSALGMLVADFRKELSRSVLLPLNSETEDRCRELFAAMETESTELLEAEGFDPARRQVVHQIDMRYLGQSYELTIPYTRDFISRFHARHQQLYSYRMRDEDCEVVNLRTSAVGLNESFRFTAGSMVHEPARIHGRTDVYADGRWQSVDLYRRKDLSPGQPLNSPALLAGDHSTVWIEPGFSACVDPYGCIILERKP